MREGRISHAQLIAGGEGSGGLAMALAYARYVNCTDRSDSDSCGKCLSCFKMNTLEHPDLHFVFPVNTSKLSEDSGTGDIKRPISDHFIGIWRKKIIETGGYITENQWYETIEIGNKQGNISKFEASEIIRKLSFKSFEAQYKVMVIWLPEKMNDAAANTLLKLIEEPYERTLFLLVSHQPDHIIGTILSRTQIVNLPMISTDLMTSHLISADGVDPSQAAQIAHLSMGNYIEAKHLLSSDESKEQLFDYFVRLMRLSYKREFSGIFDWADEVATLGRETQKSLCEYSIGMLRNCYMVNIGLPAISYLYGKEAAFCKNFHPYVNERSIEPFIREFESVIRHIGQNGNPKIIFSHFALVASKIINDAKISALDRR